VVSMREELDRLRTKECGLNVASGLGAADVIGVVIRTNGSL
jgi:hypothetical protein